MKNKKWIKVFIVSAIVAIAIVICVVVIKYFVARRPFYYAGTLETTKVVISSRVASDVSDVYVIEGDNVSVGQPLMEMSCDVYKILAQQIDKDYMAACGSEVDLLKTFSETFSAFNTALKPVMQYLLNNNNTGTKLLYLREWGDSLHSQFKHDVHCYHIVNIEFSDGSSATQNDMASGDVIVNAYPLDWELIYELSDSITPSKQK